MKRLKYLATSMVNFEVVPCHVLSFSKSHGNSTDDKSLVWTLVQRMSTIEDSVHTLALLLPQKCCGSHHNLFLFSVDFKAEMINKVEYKVLQHRIFQDPQKQLL